MKRTVKEYKSVKDFGLAIGLSKLDIELIRQKTAKGYVEAA